MVKHRQTAYIGIDPGAINYAIAGVDSLGRVTFVRMLHDTIWSVAKKYKGLRGKFRREISLMLYRERPHAVICENFTVRGFGTNSIELVGLMNGTLQALCDEYSAEEHMVMSSTWKRELCKKLGIEKLTPLYEEARAKCLPPHIIDALCMAMYVQGGLSFGKFKQSTYKANVTAAAKMLPEADRIKPRRVRK